HEDGKPDLALFQSLAIIEYLDEAFPNTRRLLPSDPLDRAKVRIICDCIASGIQPLQNVTVLWQMDKVAGKEGVGQQYAKQMMSDRFGQLQEILKGTAGKY